MSNKLELTWHGKDQEIRIEPRLLIEKPELSNVGNAPDTENMLIHGDNLLALKALESKYTGQVRCIYIDPPYNTGSAFEHYDDNLEHSQWLNLMRPRLEILKNLLADDGSIWISIDDDEGHYLKVLCDEIFGRNNFISTVIWEKRYAPTNDSKFLSDSHDFILVYAKNKNSLSINLLPRTEQQNKYYKYDDNDGRGRWRSDNVLVKSFSESGVFPIVNPNTGVEYYPPQGSCYRFSKETAERYLKEDRFYFGKDGKGAPQLKRYLSEVKQGVTAMTIWKRDDVSDNQEAKKEVKAFNSESVFATPKPERLIERVLTLATNEGDLVLDSFLGSGTTAAVAHKMGRKYIGIEMGEHAYTHCKKRLDMVISGEDKGGISKSVNWTGGGGYRFYELAPTLINKDDFDAFIINPAYSPDMLAAAMALHEGFTYQPDAECFWKQSHGSENSYLFVTTRHLTVAFLDSIAASMEDNEYLVIACCSFEKGLEKSNPHIAIKKIPQMLLERCEFDKSDYSLNIIHPPVYEDEEDCDA
ncbi:MAG: site-specific DNA-methyltransferase [Ruminococcus flavefaciens]|nr:site-specific DNA-methyltransferase [Ruminococcus flavefaciens]MCM1061239.1 site-specific DNA-methyltransferase [Eubacterium sp.]